MIREGGSDGAVANPSAGIRFSGYWEPRNLEAYVARCSPSAVTDGTPRFRLLRRGSRRWVGPGRRGLRMASPVAQSGSERRVLQVDRTAGRWLGVPTSDWWPRRPWPASCLAPRTNRQNPGRNRPGWRRCGVVRLGVGGWRGRDRRLSFLGWPGPGPPRRAIHSWSRPFRLRRLCNRSQQPPCQTPSPAVARIPPSKW